MLHPFYPIVPDLSWIARIVPLGVKTVQLRIKDTPLPEIAAQIEQALAICAKHDCQLIVNDYWDLALELGATFVHLGQEDLANADIDAITKRQCRLGISTHSLEELETALAIRPDYVALGPIYETTLKKMPWAPQGLDRIGQWKSKIGCPLVAIGGISLERAENVFAAGADSIAVVTDIVTHPKPEKRVRSWLDAVEKA